MIEIRTKLRASALALALASFTTVGCIDNSGNKTYPRADAGSDLGVEDTASDTPVTSDAPADTPGPGDTAAATDTAGDHADTATSGDTASDRGDTATSGDTGDAPGSDIRVDVPPVG